LRRPRNGPLTQTEERVLGSGTRPQPPGGQVPTRIARVAVPATITNSSPTTRAHTFAPTDPGGVE